MLMHVAQIVARSAGQRLDAIRRNQCWQGRRLESDDSERLGARAVAEAVTSFCCFRPNPLIENKANMLCCINSYMDIWVELKED